MITVRELRADDDLDSVLKLCRDFFHEYEMHHEEFFDLDNLTDDDISGRIVSSISDNESATLIALKSDLIIGYASLVIRDQPRFYKVKKVGAISALMVAKESRRKGAATLLIKEAERWFREREIKYFTFFTAIANRGATRFYERIGFTPLHVSFVGATKSGEEE